jgi:membrane protease YdiL (CAAX protease family)
MADMLNAGGHMPTEGFSFPLIVLLVFIGASTSEELLFRGLIQGYLTPLTGVGFTLRGIRISVPVLVSAILFGLMHMALISAGATLGAVLTIVISGMVLGIIAGYYREKTGSLLPAILTHICFNIWGSVADHVFKLR